MRVEFIDLLENRVFKITIICVITFVLLFVLLHPFLALTVIPSIKHSGIILYEEDNYLKFDDAILFQEGLAQLTFIDEAEAIEFIYYDSFLRDTWGLWGKYPDVFMLELDIGSQYESVEAELTAKSFVKVSNIKPVIDCYYLGDPKAEYGFFVALYEENSTAICFLVTDCDYATGLSVLARNSWLPW